MKIRLLYALSVIMAIAFSGCTDLDRIEVNESDGNVASSFCYTKDEAQAIGQHFASLKMPSRSTESNVSVEYIVSEGANRSLSLSSDTLAYVLNYPGNRGFVVVAADKRVFPILAYSDKGTFENKSGQEDIVDRMFLAPLPYYLDQKISEYQEEQSLSRGGLDPWLDLELTGYTIEPLLKECNWHQSVPYNRYCPRVRVDPKSETDTTTAPALVGCVPLAMSQVALISKETLSLPDFTVNSTTALFNEVTGNCLAPWHEQSLDSLYMLFAKMGALKIGTRYGYESTSAGCYAAKNELQRLGLHFKQSDFQNFDVDDIVFDLRRNHIILMWGDAVVTATNVQVDGHFWVVDGADVWGKEHWLPDGEFIKFLHHEFAFTHTDRNGYYLGDTWQSGDYTFGKPGSRFLSVIIEK